MKKLRCVDCDKHPVGICELTGKEVPISYALGRNQGVPRFCPLKGEKK